VYNTTSPPAIGFVNGSFASGPNDNSLFAIFQFQIFTLTLFTKNQPPTYLPTDQDQIVEPSPVSSSGNTTPRIHQDLIPMTKIHPLGTLHPLWTQYAQQDSLSGFFFYWI